MRTLRTLAKNIAIQPGAACQTVAATDASAVRLGKGYVKKVAVFGNAGGGKSTLSRKLAELTDLPLYRTYHLQHHRWTQQKNDPDLSLSALVLG